MSETTPDATSSSVTSTAEAADLRQWQRKLLPVMVRMLLGLAVFFFVASLLQLAYLHWRMEQTSPLDLREAREILSVGQGTSESDRREAALLLMRGLLEADAMHRRHHQARVLLMSRTWTVYLGFVTGMSLALLGAAFVLGRVQGTSTSVKLDAGTIKAEIIAAAPGMVLAFLGVALMVATILVNHTITVEDKNIYLWSDGGAGSSTKKPAFPPLAEPAPPASEPRR